MPASPKYRPQPASPTPSNGSTLVGSPHSHASSITLVNSPAGYPTSPQSHKSYFEGYFHTYLAERCSALQFDLRVGLNHYMPAGPYGIDALAVDWKNGQTACRLTIQCDIFWIDVQARHSGFGVTVREVIQDVTHNLQRCLVTPEEAHELSRRSINIVPGRTRRIDVIANMGRVMFAGLTPIPSRPFAAQLHLR